MMANVVAVELGMSNIEIVAMSNSELKRMIARDLTFSEYLSEMMSEIEQSIISRITPKSNTLAGLSVLNRLNSLGVSSVSYIFSAGVRKPLPAHQPRKLLRATPRAGWLSEHKSAAEFQMPTSKARGR